MSNNIFKTEIFTDHGNICCTVLNCVCFNGFHATNIVDKHLLKPDHVTLCICPSHLRMTVRRLWFIVMCRPVKPDGRCLAVTPLTAFTGHSPWPQRWQPTHNASLSLTWHEHTEHLSLSRTQICPLCLTLLSWMQSPVQLCPCGQRQSYPPSRLKHTVSLAQVLRPVRHSSMSGGGGGETVCKHAQCLRTVCVCVWTTVPLQDSPFAVNTSLSW